MQKLPVLAALMLAGAAGAPAARAAEDPVPVPAPAPAPAPEEGAAKAEPKPERKVDEKALAALERWGSKMHLPANAEADVITSYASAVNRAMFDGGDLSVKLTWKRDGGLDLGVELPDAMKKRLQPQAQEMMRGLFRTWAREALAPAFESPAAYAKDYDVGLRKEGEREVVELLPHVETAAAELQLLYFDEAGLCERRILVPHVDPRDPAQQMLVGVEIETTFGYEKIGEKNVLRRMSMLLPFGDLLVEYEYFEVDGAPPLVKSIRMVTPFAPDPIDVVFHDYSLGDTLLAGTEAKESETPKTEEPAGQDPAEKPAEEGSGEKQADEAK